MLEYTNPDRMIDSIIAEHEAWMQWNEVSNEQDHEAWAEFEGLIKEYQETAGD